MRCPNCGIENHEDARFCDRCGTSIPLVCTACGAFNRVGAKFCKGCGSTFDEPSATARAVNRPSEPSVAKAVGASDLPQGPEPKAPEPEGERKMLTALFADIKGSTALM